MGSGLHPFKNKLRIKTLFILQKSVFKPSEDLALDRNPLALKATWHWPPGTCLGIWLWQLAHTGNLVATASYWNVEDIS
jgi:hypothetical protein